jgi:hypothetical protein
VAASGASARLAGDGALGGGGPSNVNLICRRVLCGQGAGLELPLTLLALPTSRRGDRVKKAASQTSANQTGKVLPGKAVAVITLFLMGL